jgi:hypothetical protein
MNLHKITLIIALAYCGMANADIVTVIDAVETIPSNISVPTSPNGRLMFRPCASECDKEYVAVRLTENTEYYIKSQKVDFLGFRKVFFNMSQREDGYALVAYDTSQKTVTRITIGH